MSLLVAGLLVVVVLGLTLAPLWQDSELPPEELSESARERAAAMDRRTILYEGIRDLDFDFATGKLTEADHQSLRVRLLNEAAAVNAKLDSMADVDVLDGFIERAVAARRKKATVAVCSACQAELEPGDRFCHGCGHKLGDQNCGSCGAELRGEAPFCAQCGKETST